MNQLFVTLGIEAWKPWLSILVMPPLPLLLLALFGVWQVPRRRFLGRSALMVGLLGLRAVCTTAVGGALMDGLTQPPPTLPATQHAVLAQDPHAVILVLGAGRRLKALDYGAPDLSPLTLERLRYGAWLAKKTGLPLAYSGGVGHGALVGMSEAEIVRQVAERDFGIRPRWTEDRSRDTHENAMLSVPLLRAQGITRIVLVTHGFHQRRALAAFGRALQGSNVPITLVPAPVGLEAEGTLEFGDWLPSAEGLVMTRLALHEWLGRLAGA